MSEYQYFKIKFDKKRYRRLLERIVELADGESVNLAMRDQVIIWFENERRGNLPQLGQNMAITPENEPNQPPNEPSSEADTSADSDDLEDLW